MVDQPREGPAVPQRRLTLTPIAFDLITALSQARNGIRLAEIANLVGSPVSSVQASLRILMANEIVHRHGDDPPLYVLNTAHPGHEALVNVAAVLPEPEHVIGIVLRASPAVSFAAIDQQGFVFALADDADPADIAILEAAIDTVVTTRRSNPALVQMGGQELRRLARVDVGLWARLTDAVRLKGRLPAVRAAVGG